MENFLGRKIKNILIAMGMIFSGIGVYVLDKYWDSLYQLVSRIISHSATGWIILFLFIMILVILVIFEIKKIKEPKPKGVVLDDSPPIQKPKEYLKEDLDCKEKFDQEIWDILQKIKTNIFHTKKRDILVKYKKNFTKFTEKYEQEESILEKIEDMRAIEIMEVEDACKYIGNYTINNPTTALTIKDLDASKYLKYIGSTNTIFLNILPKFNKVYKKYENKFIKK